MLMYIHLTISRELLLLEDHEYFYYPLNIFEVIFLA